MTRPSELEQEIARLLDRHGHSYDSDCGVDFGCGCGAINDYDKSGTTHTNHLLEVLMPTVRKSQAEALRKVAAQMDEFIGTILNPAGCAAIARTEAERIEKLGND